LRSHTSTTACLSFRLSCKMEHTTSAHRFCASVPAQAALPLCEPKAALLQCQAQTPTAQEGRT
jgi:hypothetical protein